MSLRRAAVVVAVGLAGVSPPLLSDTPTSESSPIRSGTAVYAVGAGTLDSWDTEFEIRAGRQAASVYVGVHPPPSACPISFCGTALVAEIPKGGGETVAASEVSLVGPVGVRTFTIGMVGEGGPYLRPVGVIARIVNRARPEQTAELPLVDYRTLFFAQPPDSTHERDRPKPALTFPARREAGRHTNLVVALIEGESQFLRIDFLDAAGATVRWMAPRGPMHRGQTDLFTDVLSTLPEDFDGSIRITRLAPEGLFWATLAHVYADGRLELLAPTTGMSSMEPVSGGDQ